MAQTPKRKHLLKARCRTREKALIHAGAIAAEMSVSELIRQSALAEARRLLAETGGRP